MKGLRTALRRQKVAKLELKPGRRWTPSMPCHGSGELLGVPLAPEGNPSLIVCKKLRC